MFSPIAFAAFLTLQNPSGVVRIFLNLIEVSKRYFLIFGAVIPAYIPNKFNSSCFFTFPLITGTLGSIIIEFLSA